MKIIFDVGFGRKTLYELYKSTEMSSRLQYGLVQLEKKYCVEHISWKPFSIKGLFLNNLKVLEKCDAVFLNYLYVQPILLLLLLRKFGFYRGRKVIAISHISLRDGRNKIESFLLRIAYGSFDKILFHSPKNMEESICSGLISRDLCEFLCWGDDLDYIDNHIKISSDSTFLSTGREHRDYSTLVNAFSRKTNLFLNIYTNLINYDNDYTSLKKWENEFSNINIEFVEKSAETTKRLAQKVGDCFCVVIPVEQEGLYYCVGFTSVVEAMAMSKPIVSTRNPYYPIDLEKEGIGIYVDDVNSWCDAIDYLFSHPDVAFEMGRKARKLAEEKYNILECSKQIDRIINC